jgi:8-amino-3,8-dideoxy-alpha-D-manno-octulosonate transaminase
MPGYELVGKEEQIEVNKIFENGGILCRRGFENIRNGSYKVEEFESNFSERFGGFKSLAVTSGTAALRIALAALNISKGDEVIAPSFTFVATLEAIIESGATPVCTEVNDTLNMDVNDLLLKITEKTKAVIVVHMLGIPSDLKKIVAICKEKSIFLIEDTAWGCGGSLDGIPLGTWGDIGTFSFDFAKTITTGEGGMLLFKDENVFKKAAAWHDHGHDNNPMVQRWEDTRSSSGFNYRMSELQAAVGIAQLRKLDYVIECQRSNRDIILERLNNVNGIVYRNQPEGTFDTADALIFFVESANLALKCRSELLNVGISTKILPEAYTWHFAETWNHMPELVASHGNDLCNAFPLSRNLLKRSVSIPINVKMESQKIYKIEEAIKKSLNAQ